MRSQAKNDERRRLGERLCAFAQWLLLGGLFARACNGGLAAELMAPWSNAFLEGLLILSALVLATGQMLQRDQAEGARGWRLAPPQPLSWPLLIYFLALALALWPAQDWDIAWRTALSQLSAGFALCAATPFLQDERSRRRLLGFLLAVPLLYSLMAIYEVAIEFDAAAAELKNNPGLLQALDPGQRREFEARLGSRAAAGPFLISNVLAGALVLWWPILACLCVLAWRQGKKKSLRWAGAALTLIVAGLLLTRSKGFVPASLVALWAALYAWPHEASARLRRPALLATAVLGLSLATFAFVQLYRAPEVHGFGLSMKIRLEYWQAGYRMWRESPVLGKGLGNYRTHYSRLKPARSEETKYAHSSIVQLAAEQGLVGLAASLTLLAAALLSLRRPSPPLEASAETEPVANRPDSSDALSSSSLLGGLAFGLIFVALTPGRYSPIGEAEPATAWLRLLIYAGFTFGAARLFQSLLEDLAARPAEAKAESELDDWLRVGVLAGLAGLLAHSLLDFTLSAPAIQAQALLLLGIGAQLSTPKTRAGPSSRGVAEMLWRALAVLGALILLFWSPRMQRYRQALEPGRERLMAAASAPRDPRAAEWLGEAIAELKRAAEILPCRDSWHSLAGAYESRFNIGGEASDLSAMSQAYENAVLADPGAAGLYAQRAAALLGALARLPEQAPRLREQALADLRAACRLYPTHPRYQLERARLLIAHGSPETRDEALSAAQSAVQSSEDSRLDRLKLTEVEIQEMRNFLKK